MSIAHSLLAFVVAAALATMTPGLDTALVLRTATVEGGRRAAQAMLGICCGVLTWGVIIGFGLGALLVASQRAYTVLRWVGAAYLCYLGVGMLLRPRRAFVALEARQVADATTAPAGEETRSWFARGLLTNLLNPKVGVFYVTFLPQFIPAGVNVRLFTMLLAAIHSLEGLLWFTLLIAATRPLAATLRNPRTIATLDRVTGAVLILFGLRLAAEVVAPRPS